MTENNKISIQYCIIFSIFLFLLNGCAGGPYGSHDMVLIFSPWRLAGVGSLKSLKDNPGSKTSYELNEDDMSFCKGICKLIERNYFYLSSNFKQSNIVIQKTMEDCWAATSIMLLKNNVSNFSNIEFYQKLEKHYQNESLANYPYLYIKLIRMFREAVGERPVSQDFIYYSLANGYPVMVGLDNDNGRGHVVLLTGVYFSFMEKSILKARGIDFASDKFEYVDPLDGKYYLIDADEFIKNVSFGISLIPLNILEPNVRR